MSESVGAWLLPFAQGSTVAVSDFETVEYIGMIARTVIPQTPNHCASVMRWRDRFVPVFELDALLGLPDSVGAGSVIVLAYPAGDDVDYCGLKLHGSPVRVQVVDDDACDLVDCEFGAQLSEQGLALSAFSVGDEAVAILDVTALVSMRPAPIIERSANPKELTESRRTLPALASP